jgi:glutamate N-acetyltransferase/amino-acid N-acetyltransferase
MKNLRNNLSRHITLPRGFLAGATACGIKPSGKRDLGIIAGQVSLSAAVVTTSNQIIGEPIRWIRSVLPRGYGTVRGVVINSGNSNVCTGQAGFADAETMAGLTAKALDTTAEKILVASTGVIGQPLPMTKVRRGIIQAGGNMGLRNDSAFLQAMMTTDLREKSALVQATIDRRAVTVAGVVKGSGMIAPSLATMIGVITTDAAISPAVLGSMLKQAVRGSFNAVTVDTDQSTSDVVVLLASGQAGGANAKIAKKMPNIKPGTAACKKFRKALQEVCHELAWQIAADGEGATRVVRVRIGRAGSDADARAAAMSVANSPLVKTAIHGADPNWGRIAMALGKSPAKVQAETLTIKIGSAEKLVKVFARGRGCKFDEKTASKLLAGPEVVIDCDLGLGKGKFQALTCDLSREYISINADYTT